MAPARTRRTRHSTDNSLNILNRINTRSMGTRRSTDVYTIPVSPERRQRPRKSEPASATITDATEATELQPTEAELRLSQQHTENDDEYFEAQENGASDQKESNENVVEAIDASELPSVAEETPDEQVNGVSNRKIMEDDEMDSSSEAEEPPVRAPAQSAPPSAQSGTPRQSVDVVVPRSTRSTRQQTSFQEDRGNAETDWRDELGLRDPSSSESDEDEPTQVSADDPLFSQTGEGAISYVARAERSLSYRTRSGRRVHVPESQQVIQAPNDGEESGAGLDNDDDNDANLDEWLREVVEGTPLVRPWNIVLATREDLRLHRPRNQLQALKDCLKLVSELRKDYDKPSHGAEGLNLQSCHNLREALKAIRVRLFDKASFGPQSNRGSRVINQFEAVVVPSMINLVLACFKAYHNIGLPAYRELCSILELLQETCDQISSRRSGGHPPGLRARSNKIRRPLKRIHDAVLDRDSSIEPKTPMDRQGVIDVDDTDDVDDWDAVLRSQEPWTFRELNHLFDGFRQFSAQGFSGLELCIQVLRHRGHLLPGRTLTDLVAKAQEVRHKCERHRRAEGWIASL
ncbi:conserved glutamic acid-rich protein [Penicillium lagena]|uniref:conserved glutamic acid-rich protein n=1 Tax=Penicillium lagena TaxID=94218 RepID=UPI00253F9057|nr:conserved glutamic acid-rich protein [Penicillium lagena]KAJ5619808.1 conserved glutamic acid-rich protein [Penicillium lagena]